MRSLNKYLLSVGVLVTSFLSMLIFAPTAEASFDSMPTRLPKASSNSWLRLNTNVDDDGVNDQSKHLSILVYRDVRADTVLNINSPNTQHCHLINYNTYTVNDGGENSSPGTLAPFDQGGDDGLYDVNVCGGGSTITIPLEAFMESARYPAVGGNPAKYVALLVLSDKLTTDVTTFNIGRNDTSQKVRLSFLGTNSTSPATDDSALPPRSYAQLLVPKDGSNTVTSYFGAPCGFSGTRYFFWKGADSNIGNHGPVNITIKDISVGGPDPLPTQDAHNGRTIYPASVNIQSGHKYQVIFSGVFKNNGVLVWLPFDSATYDVNCGGGPTPGGWTADWADTQVEGGDSDGDTQTGNINFPDSFDAPQPGQFFKYINIAKNNGALSLTGPFTKTGDKWNPPGTSDFYLHFGNKCLAGQDPAKVVCTGPLFANTAGQIHFNNAVNDTKTGEKYALNNENKWAGYTTAANSNIGDPWSNDYGSFTVGRGDGGRVRCVTTGFDPAIGTRAAGSPYAAPAGSSPNTNEKWTYSGSDASELCVEVPYYYTFQPSNTVSGATSSTIQQGQGLTVSGNVRNDDSPNDMDGATRKHTNSESKDMGIIQLKLASGEAEPTNTTRDWLSGLGPCDFMKARAGGKGTCAPLDSGARSVNVGTPQLLSATISAADTATMAVGTKLCYTTYARHPKNIDSGDVGSAGDAFWAYDDITCITVVKKPKVQFLNTDVTVGKGISDGATCNSVDGAPIITASAAGGNSLYGSWVEYGAFATGAISNFGSTAYPYGLVDSEGTLSLSNRLLFGNHNGTSFVATGSQGNYIYNNKCLPDVSQYVSSTNYTKLNDPAYSVTIGVSQYPVYIPNSNGQVRLDRLINRADDKTGYVADGGQGIQFGVEPVDLSEDPGGGGGALAGTYRVVQCRSNTNTPPAGWSSSNSGAPFYTSAGCNGTNHGIEVAIGQSSGIRYANQFAQWTFNAPVNTSLNWLKANRRVDVASATGYDDQKAVLSTDLGNIEECYRYASTCPPSQTGDINTSINGATYISMKVYCAAFGPMTTCTAGDVDTRYSLSDITLTLNDGSVPVLTPSGSFRQNTGKELIYNVTDTGSGVNRVTVVAKKAGDATAPEVSLYSAIPDSNGGKCDDSDATVPVPCPPNVAKTVDLSGYLSTLDDGVYEITMTASDKANNKDTKTWKYAVNNVLPANTDAFKDRDIVLYAKKTAGEPCSAMSSGNIRIYQNIEFQQYGYNSISELPRLVLIADCNIMIHRSVDKVYASLVAGDAIKTCDVQSKSKDICQKALTIKGGVVAKRLLLWRTANAELPSGDPTILSGDPTIPAETFNVSPTQILTKYNRGFRSSSATTADEVDLPPRY